MCYAVNTCCFCVNLYFLKEHSMSEMKNHMNNGKLFRFMAFVLTLQFKKNETAKCESWEIQQNDINKRCPLQILKLVKGQMDLRLLQQPKWQCLGEWAARHQYPGLSAEQCGETEW